MKNMKINQKKNVLAFIPARGGSKGIPQKNIALLAGKPLISYTIEAAKKALSVDRVVVSTDCNEIASIALEFGAEVPFLRPKELAGDKSDLRYAIFHCMDFLEKADNYVVDIMVTLFPTYPFRSHKDISKCVEDVNNGALASITVSSPISHPYKCFTADNGKLSPLVAAERIKAELSNKTNITMSNCSIVVSPAFPRHVRKLGRFDLITEAFNKYSAELVHSGKYSGEYLMHEVDKIRSIDIDSFYHLKYAEKVLEKKLFDFDKGFYE
jgi:CMP-N-acetylneuraminic acid synthetase